MLKIKKKKICEGQWQKQLMTKSLEANKALKRIRNYLLTHSMIIHLYLDFYISWQVL